LLSESLTKTKLSDPLILELLQNIREHRSMLEDLKSIKIDPKLTNIISEEISVDLERPRDREKIEQDPTYLKIKMRLEKHLLRETRAVEEVT